MSARSGRTAINAHKRAVTMAKKFIVFSDLNAIQSSLLGTAAPKTLFVFTPNPRTLTLSVCGINCSEIPENPLRPFYKRASD